ncbi:MAG: type IV-A pilus assembly ATPase PilB [endosymbiont of Galathealinum brachiosum]|uniref:Type IV-A pilus assembly ATPase PilB n=1 Tax=endosymbiont of Galathealinum brachiosum TaxID=2200906 RepID=A0A370DAC2_9GAMM|nr:MAG: type IV-A pilus assembly ATPase PilB [endosymbiont of Galathealinum brachiosum]
MAPDQKLSGLTRRLVLDGLLEEKQALEAQTEAKKEKLNLSQYLVSKKLIAANKLATIASNEFGIPLLDLDSLDAESIPNGLVNEDLIKKHQVLPLYKRGNRLYVATSEPTNLLGIDEIKFQTGINTEAILVEADKLTKIIEKSLEAKDDGMNELLDDDLDDLDFEDTETTASEDDSSSEADDTPVVRFVNKVLLDAIKKGASDIHFEPYEKRYRVRLRIDGVLREVASPPNAMGGRLSARIKVMSRMDTAERRIPQDGRIKMRISKNKAIDFRVNTCPTLFGEKIVLRILDASAAKLGIDMLGYEPAQKELYMEALANPYGMILVTGPTGSGKTVSLYTGLNILNTEDRNISTAEDPVEINLEGINQVNMNPKVGLDFNSTLRAFLRQDPDIIMVGEIRDLETASIAIKAAQTGHMVMSTLHTNDAPQTLSRLINMGVPPFNIASAVNLIIAQRLARRLCENCKTEENIPKEALVEEGFPQEDIDKGIKLYKAVGCEQCDKGFKGRVGIYQVMKISEEMGRIIMREGNALELADQAQKEGIPDLRQSAIVKAMSGVTSLEEINRVTKD